MIRFQYPEGATPIDADELPGLIPDISTQSELNDFEAENIRDAIAWAQRSRKLRNELLTVSGLKLLHRKMFDRVWKWSGTFRLTEKNIGTVLSYQVQEEVHKLCDDVRYQIGQGVSDWHRCALLFHYRLVTIHPFANGNGRHARLSADMLLRLNGQKPLSWGRSELVADDEVRREYITALRQADAGDIEPLVLFATREQ